MLGLALLQRDRCCTETLLRGPGEVVGYLCLPVARRRMHWRARSRLGLHALS